MKNLRMRVLVAILLGFSVFGVKAFSQGANVANSAVELTESGVSDVIELLKFVKTAKPELYEKFAGSFEDVGASCSQGVLNEQQANDFANTVATIQADMPDNGSLMTKIRLATL